MSKEKSLKEYGLLSLKGMAMGAADVIPGVSGGTIAFITGIYEELLETISNVNLAALKKLKSEGLKSFWKHINGNFIVALFAGIAISFVTLAKVSTYLMEHTPVQLWSFFFGLVAASIFYVGKQVEKWNVGTITSFIVGAVAAYFITILPPLAGSDSLVFLFLSGMIAICAMILPGISGSFILLILGAYKIIMEAISDFNLMIIGTVALGCLIGLISFSHILKWLFANYKSITIATLTGFLLGSLNKLWPWKHVEKIYVKHLGEVNEEAVALVEKNVLPNSFDTFLYEGEQITGYVKAENHLSIALLCFAVGFGIIFLMEFVAKKMKPQKPL
jgi:putative membrane protein